MRTVRIGAGAGYSGDRIEPALELAGHGALDFLVFECLAERTVALAQLARQRNAEAGFDPYLAERLQTVLPACIAHGTRIVTNMGAANPLAAAREAARIARSLGLKLRIAAITGDDVTDLVRARPESPLVETQGVVGDVADRMISANAYLGAWPVADALAGGADLVITGRIGDPAMFLAPIAHSFGWPRDDWRRLGCGTAVGHMLECAGQVTGGYYADPGLKDVEGLARLGFPLAEVAEDGTAVITKVAGSGGRVDAAICAEQLLYEVHDPARYMQPDLVADFSRVTLAYAGADRVTLAGATGTAPTDTLKVSIGYRDSFVGEGEISYRGEGAGARAALAIAIVRERLELTAAPITELHVDIVGREPGEVRIRVAGRAATSRDAARIGREVEALYTNGPAAGGGARSVVREVIAVVSTLIDRALVETSTTWIGT
ncbi:acyclic terpene utilization AtuA family protein [Lichenicoccus roseus]|uniref:DUF1446 domain-containing protein n=1 Tax=Lichenicoccus roseus TaxID=2683649 RepID=A0A5R9JD64_9PROT|nr:acyclic terpene utilization AtuA family protein [Lichenicoccus roseus]TLU73336.1 DUF1446 domain-containing protein [Lichenicoccus roseus]